MLLLLSLLACTSGEVGPEIDLPPLLPFPSTEFMVPDHSTISGWRLELDADLIPTAEDGTPVPVERLNRLDGFSVANTGVVLLGVEVDERLLPGYHKGGNTRDVDSPVQLVELETGERVPIMAELDAHPQADTVEEQVLLLRPLEAMKPATHYAWVITDDLTDPDGQPLAMTARLAALLDSGDLHAVDMVHSLKEWGLPKRHLVEAWDFWTASRKFTRAPLERLLETSRDALPPDPELEPDYTVDRFVERGDPDFEQGEHTWRLAEGTVTLPSFLVNDEAFQMGNDDLPYKKGVAPVDWMVFVPRSLEDAPAGSAPVLVFGHGILSDPAHYLKDPEDPSDVQELADRMGMIVIATPWRGLCSDDLASALAVGADFGTLYKLTDKMMQGLANASALTRLPRTAFAEADFLAASEGGSLVDPERVYYMGISMGGILGGTLLATAEPEELEYGVLHVGGSTWSTMLERSSDWPPFEAALENSVPSPVDRQILYALSQSFWDPVDPIAYSGAFSDKSVLWQESMGDEQVPNLTTESLVRSANVPVIRPAVSRPFMVTALDGPLGPGASALMQMDPGLGRPEEINRPASASGAHDAIRHTEEAKEQIETFFTEGAEGTIIHPCAPDPCVFE